MNPLARQLNEDIFAGNPSVKDMLSSIGANLFFPKGLLTQGAEAKEKAHHINATIGIAKEEGHSMVFDSVTRSINGIRPSASLTYAPSYGIPAMRQLWQEALLEKNPSLAGKAISLPVVTSGITHAVSVFADVWADPGDVVILPDKFWGNYNMIFKVRKQMEFTPYPLFTEQLEYNLAGLEEAVGQAAQKHSKIIVLFNFPQNPTGYTITRPEGERIAEILTAAAESGTRVIAVCDDAYFGLFYEPETLKDSLFALLNDRHPRLLAVKLDGATKENFVWGLRVGFVTYGCPVTGDPRPFYEALEKKTAGCVRGSVSNVSHLSQTLLLNSMQDERYPAEKKEKFDILKRRAQRVKAVLTDSKYDGAWDMYPFNSGYFMCLRLKTVEAEALRSHLLNTYGVGLIALGKHDLRVAFSCVDEAQIPELFDIILQGIQELTGTEDTRSK